jgi:hypothetical protein
MKREDFIQRPDQNRPFSDRWAFLATHFDYFEIAADSPFANYYITRVKQGWKVGQNTNGNHRWLVEPTLESAIDAILEDRELLTEDEHEAEEREMAAIEWERHVAEKAEGP